MHRPPRILLVSGKSQPGFNIAPPLGLHQLHHYLTARGIESEVLARDLMQPDGHIARTAQGAYGVVGFSVSHDNMPLNPGGLTVYPGNIGQTNSARVSIDPIGRLRPG